MKPNHTKTTNYSSNYLTNKPLKSNYNFIYQTPYNNITNLNQSNRIINLIRYKPDHTEQYKNQTNLTNNFYYSRIPSKVNKLYKTNKLYKVKSIINQRAKQINKSKA